MAVVPSGVPYEKPSAATLPERPLCTYRSNTGQAASHLPIFCAVLSIYAFQSAAWPRLSLLMPAAGTRPHPAL
jgi:hypothetical protein